MIDSGNMSGKRALQGGVVSLAGQFVTTELAEVAGHPLGVQKHGSILTQRPDQRDESDLRGIGLAGEHAFSKKDSGQGNSIEAALQSLGIPALDGVRESQLLETAIAFEDGFIDPCFLVGIGLFEFGMEQARQTRPLLQPGFLMFSNFWQLILVDD